MELFSRFKKDYANYLLSVILPALISGLSIPILKNILGAEGYGKFALWYNAILILTAIFSGWIAQSILRFFPASTNQQNFSKRAIHMALTTQLCIAIPVFVIVWWIGKDLLLAVLFPLVLLGSSLQLTIIPLAQSSFLSRKIIYSETIRIVTYIGGAVILLLFTPVYYLYSLFLAVLLSYTFSFLFLKRHLKSHFSLTQEANQIESFGSLYRRFLKYGAPLSMWYVFSYLVTYIDKLFVFYFFGASIQGNYQAIFDLINKSLALLISPVIASLFPLLTAAYEKGDRADIRGFMKKILAYEFGGFLLTGVLYWIFGYHFLFYILNVPDTTEFRWMGFIIICATFIWQFSILAQKRFELKLRSFYMLAMVFIAFLSQVIFYTIFRNMGSQLIAPLGYLVAALVYLSLIALPEILNFRNIIRTKILTRKKNRK